MFLGSRARAVRRADNLTSIVFFESVRLLAFTLVSLIEKI
jgi:hypothetical protein